MPRPYKPCIPRDLNEVRDHVGAMMLGSPTFVDRTGYFPGKNLQTTFYELNEGLRLFRGQLGEELYLKLVEMSDQMRAHFEADPENKTDDTLKGRDIIVEMLDLLRQRGRKS